MKVAISSTGTDLDAQVDPRFGRCAHFIIVETDDMSWFPLDNPSGAAASGAGVNAASFIVASGAETVITGNCGPKAEAAFAAAGVRVIAGRSGTVREALQRLNEGDPVPTPEPTAPKSAGSSPRPPAAPASGSGTGRCRGGAGRGMGMGRGKGMGGGRCGKSGQRNPKQG
jgi:predicted Fe-Mo cluster-binding NifX family protein